MGDLKLVVAGCVAQQEGAQLLRRVPELDLVLGPQHANRWVVMNQLMLHSWRGRSGTAATAHARTVCCAGAAAANRGVVHCCQRTCPGWLRPATSGPSSIGSTVVHMAADPSCKGARFSH